jgi:hypothetical protein
MKKDLHQNDPQTPKEIDTYCRSHFAIGKAGKSYADLKGHMMKGPGHSEL